MLSNTMSPKTAKRPWEPIVSVTQMISGCKMDSSTSGTYQVRGTISSIRNFKRLETYLPANVPASWMLRERPGNGGDHATAPTTRVRPNLLNPVNAVVTTRNPASPARAAVSSGE